MTTDWIVGMALVIAGLAATSAAGQDAACTGTPAAPRAHIVQIKIRFRDPALQHPFTVQDLLAAAHSYEGSDLSEEDLARLTQQLTRMYVDTGYITSGAVLEDQDLNKGILTVTIVEGVFPKIAVTGKHRLHDKYLEARIAPGSHRVFRMQDLEDRLQQLHLDPRVQHFTAVLKPGDSPGSSQLELQLQESPPVAFGVQFNNYQSPIVGSERIQGSAAVSDLTGLGDQLAVTYGHSSGVSPLLNASYSFLLGPSGGTVELGYRRSAFAASDSVFQDLAIASTSDIYEVGFRRPVWRGSSRARGETRRVRSTHELALGIQGDHERNVSSLLGIPFSFAPGAVNGVYVISALRLNADFTLWKPAEVLAVRSRLSIGLDLLGSTIHDGIVPAGSALYPGSRLPDSRFVSWLGQFQWSRRFDLLGIRQGELVARVDGQLANHALLPLEQLPVGGRYSVRGFRENELVHDQGIVESYEVRVPVIQQRPWASRLELAAFEDVGYGVDKGIQTQGRTSIGSAGLGLRWQAQWGRQKAWNPGLEFYWGALRFHRNASESGNLQDRGIHFQLSFNRL